MSGYIKRVVPRNSKQQPDGRPLYGVGDKGGEYVFYNTLIEPKDVRAFREASQEKVLNHSIRLLEIFIANYSDSPLKQEAKTVLRAKRWEKARIHDNIESYADL